MTDFLDRLDDLLVNLKKDERFPDHGNTRRRLTDLVEAIRADVVAARAESAIRLPVPGGEA